MSIPDRYLLNDFCAKSLLRRFRRVATADDRFVSPRVDTRDIEELRSRWALSDKVRLLAERVAEYPGEAGSSIDYVETRTNGEISGTIDTRATLIEQMMSGNPALFVVSEPSVSYLNGPNHLVAWVLREAEEAVLSLLRREREAKLLEWVHDRARILDAALRNQTLRDVSLSPTGRNRPGHAALRSAARSRSTLYRLALEAFEGLDNIEDLNEESLRDLMRETMLSPLENWQMLELSAALAAAEALATAAGEAHPAYSGVGSDRVVARAGPCSVLWQKALADRDTKNLDTSEALAKELSLSIGPDTASSRVDVCIINTKTAEEIAHIECKWFESERALTSAISDACIQIVRYARDSRPASVAEAKSLLVDSLVVVASRGTYSMRLDGSGPVGFTDFEGLMNGALEPWALRVLSRPACQTT